MKFVREKSNSWKLVTPYNKIFYGTTKKQALREFIEWWTTEGRDREKRYWDDMQAEASMQVYKGAFK